MSARRVDPREGVTLESGEVIIKRLFVRSGTYHPGVCLVVGQMPRAYVIQRSELEREASCCPHCSGSVARMGRHEQDRSAYERLAADGGGRV